SRADPPKNQPKAAARDLRPSPLSSDHDKEPLIAAQHAQRERLTRTDRAQHPRELLDRAHRCPPVHADDDVARHEARARGAARRIDVDDEHALDISVARVGAIDVPQLDALQPIYRARAAARSRARLLAGRGPDRRLDGPAIAVADIADP